MNERDEAIEKVFLEASRRYRAAAETAERQLKYAQPQSVEAEQWTGRMVANHQVSFILLREVAKMRELNNG